MIPVVKVCGNDLSSIPSVLELIEESRNKQLAVAGKQQVNLLAGVLIGEEDYDSPDFIDIRELRPIALEAPPGSLVVVTHLHELDGIREIMDRAEETITVQLHCRPALSPDIVGQLKDEYPEHRLWHVVHRDIGRDPVAKAVRMAGEFVDAGIDGFVVDSYTVNPKTGKIKVGGTGELADTSFVAAVLEGVKQKTLSAQVIRAGGLGPDNVANAIAEVRPDGVDANTRLKKDGDNGKDMRKVRKFHNEAVRAFCGEQFEVLYI